MCGGKATYYLGYSGIRNWNASSAGPQAFPSPQTVLRSQTPLSTSQDSACPVRPLGGFYHYWWLLLIYAPTQTDEVSHFFSGNRPSAQGGSGCGDLHSPGKEGHQLGEAECLVYHDWDRHYFRFGLDGRTFEFCVLPFERSWHPCIREVFAFSVTWTTDLYALTQGSNVVTQLLQCLQRLGSRLNTEFHFRGRVTWRLFYASCHQRWAACK